MRRLIFPSKLEIFGLPISEFSKCDKPMLIADLPYVHEIAYSPSNMFFNSENRKELPYKKTRLVKNLDICFVFFLFGRCVLNSGTIWLIITFINATIQ